MALAIGDTHIGRYTKQMPDMRFFPLNQIVNELTSFGWNVQNIIGFPLFITPSINETLLHGQDENKSMYKYTGDLREGVIFLFIDGASQCLLETRFSNTGEKSTFFTNGSVEESDVQECNNYLEYSMKREVHEEFLGRITPNNYQSLGRCIAEAINVVFEVFVITAWEGNFPSHTWEDGERFGELSTAPLELVEDYSPYKTTKQIIKLVNNAIKSNRITPDEDAQITILA